MLRFFKIIAECVAALVGVGAIAFCLLVWWLTAYPPDSAKLTPFIQAALGRFAPDARIEVGESVLIWDSAERFLVLKSADIKLRDGKENLIATLPVLKVKASLLGLLQGEFVPSELTIDRPSLWFLRKADGSLMFGDMATTTGEAADAEAIPVKQGLQRFMARIVDEGLLRELNVTGTVIFVHDEEARRDWSVVIPTITLRHYWSGVTGHAKIAIAQQEGMAAMEARYAFDGGADKHRVTLDFNNVNPSFLAGKTAQFAAAAMFDLPFSGDVTLVADKALNLVAATAKINGGAGRLDSPDMWEAPRAVKALSLAASYDGATRRLVVPESTLDLGGPKITFKLDGNAPQQPAADGKPYDMEFAATVGLRDLPMDEFATVWPKPAVSGAREWISSNMKKGMFTQGAVTLRGRLAWHDLGNALLESADGKLSARDARVTYLRDMPPVENVGAEATFDLSHMDVNLTGGGIGPLKLLPSTVQLTDFQSSVQNIIIPVKLAGPVRDVIKLLDAPPLGYAKAVGLRTDDGDGRIEGTLELRLPLLIDVTMNDVAVKAEAKLTDFAAAKLIPGLEISQGALALTLDDKGYALTGPLALNKVPLQAKWEGAFTATAGKPQNVATVTGNVTGEQWQQLGIKALAKSTGPTAVAIRYEQQDKTLARLSGTLDFKQAALTIDEIGWNKATNSPATLTFAAELPKDKPVAVKSLALKGAGVSAKGTAVLDGDSMELLALQLTPVIAGRTNATLRYKQEQDKSRTRRITIEGAAYDLSGLRGGDKKSTTAQPPEPADSRPLDVTLKLGKLFTNAEGVIVNAEGRVRRDAQGWREIDLRGLADGTHAMVFALKPSTPDPNGPRALTITCDNFGKFLKGLGITDGVRDGALSMQGQSEPNNPRSIAGKIKIGSFTVSGLPALVRLLNAVSPFGFIDLITGEATLDNLRGRFRWEGDVLTLQEVRTSGAVFGLNIDGQFDIETGQAALHGTVVPFSFFNRVINQIPLLGNMITGGEGQGVIAAAYTIKGPLSDPAVSVNPVSLLTPGFLRNLFFNGSDDADLPQAEPPAK